MSITPLPDVDGRLPVVFVYVKTKLQQAEQEKRHILVLVVMGACLSVCINCSGSPGLIATSDFCQTGPGS